MHIWYSVLIIKNKKNYFDPTELLQTRKNVRSHSLRFACNPNEYSHSLKHIFFFHFFPFSFCSPVI